MFSLLRIAVVVGVIFYFSPVRQAWETPSPADIAALVKKDHAAGQSLEDLSRLADLWQALPEGAKRALVDRAGEAVAQAAGAKPATDTLEPEDLKPAWRGEPARKP